MTPLQALVELLARRNVLSALVFLTGGPQSFGTVAAHVGVKEAQLSQRLRELREAGLVEVDEAGDYRLTSTGRRLQGVLDGVERFARDWAALSDRQRSPRGAGRRGRGEPGSD